MRLVLPTAPSPTRTQLTLRSGAEPDRRRFTLRGKSRFFTRRVGTGGQSLPYTGSDTRLGFCFPISWGSMTLYPRLGNYSFAVVVVLCGCVCGWVWVIKGSESLKPPCALHLLDTSRFLSNFVVVNANLKHHKNNTQVCFTWTVAEIWSAYSGTAVGFLLSAGAPDWHSLYICCGRDS